MPQPRISVSGPPLDVITNEALSALGTVEYVDVEAGGWAAVDGCWAHVLGGPELLDRDQVAALPDSVKLVCFLGTGFEAYMDVDALDDRGVVACYTPHANARATAEFAVGLLIAGLRAVPIGIRQVERDEWSPPQGRSLVDATIGVVGFGHVGEIVVRMLSAGFGVSPLVWNRTTRDDDIRRAGGEPATLETIFSDSDAVSLHINAPESGKPLIVASHLSLVRSDLVLVNTARAGVLDYEALRVALENKPEMRVLSDVYPTEPVGPGSDALGLLGFGIERFMLTPHMAYSSDDAVRQMGKMVLANLEAHVAGRPVPFSAAKR